MRHYYMPFLLLLLLLLPYTPAQDIINIDANSDNINNELVINGPAQVKVNSGARFTIENLPEIDISKSLAEQSAIYNSVQLYILAPGQGKRQLFLRSDVTFGPEISIKQPYTVVRCNEIGEYRILLLHDSVLSDNSVLTEHLFSVTDGLEPEPDPIPDPDPPTPSDELDKDMKYQIMLLQDTDQLDNLSMGQVALLSGLKFRGTLKTKGHTFKGVYDISSKTLCVDGQCRQYASPDIENWLSWYKKSGLSLPVAVFWDGKAESMIVKELPGNETDFWSLFR